MYFFSHRKGHALQQNRRFSRLFVFNNSSLISPPFVHFITKKAAPFETASSYLQLVGKPFDK